MILTRCAVEMLGDTDPSGVPSTQCPWYGLCKGEGTILSPPIMLYFVTWAFNRDCLSPLTQELLVKQLFYIFLIPPHPHSPPKIAKREPTVGDRGRAASRPGNKSA